MLLRIALFCLLPVSVCLAEVRNGYETEIGSVRKSHVALMSIYYEYAADRSISESKRARIRTKIKEVEDFICYYELTAQLLQSFKTIAPLMYDEISNIRDRKGRNVSVYVKFVPPDQTEVKAWGTTYIAQSEHDEDMYVSDYGENTVSVKIWIVPEALYVLSHELGHVKYQVPHLAEYVKFYKQKYGVSSTSNYIGHHSKDASGQASVEFEAQFKKMYASYVEDIGPSVNARVELKTIRRKVHTILQ